MLWLVNLLGILRLLALIGVGLLGPTAMSGWCCA